MTLNGLRELLGIKKLTPMEEHIQFLKNAIVRTETRIQFLYDRTMPEDCCVHCKFGSKFTKLQDKLERQEEWLEIIERKNEQSKN